MSSAVIPGLRASNHSTVLSSGSQMPVLALHSVAMLHSVARSSIDRLASPGPPNSIERSSVCSSRAYFHRMCSMMSLAVQPGSNSPVNSKRMDSGTCTKVKPLWIRLANSVEPTP